MAIFQILPVFLNLVAHLSLWTWIFNRLHAAGLRRATVHRLEKVTLVSTAVLGGSLAVWMVANSGPWPHAPWTWHSGLVAIYLLACWSMLAYVTLMWAVRRVRECRPPCLVSNHTDHLNVAAITGSLPVGDRATRWLAHIPGNQIIQIKVQHKLLRVRRLPDELDGLRIAQLSDLHLTGQLTQDFFNTAIDRANGWHPDLAVVTGDIIDKRDCLGWLPSTLGRLKGKYGQYFILGNHDERMKQVDHLRATLESCGLENLGGRCVTRSIRGVEVRMAGNECPWFPPAPIIPSLSDDDRPYSILLSHSPDQIPWARENHFDLMLAGHTHGGQIRPPLLGPLVCPSRFGVRYASGIFDEPPTLMHVSRGLSGVQPLRFWCPPELALLEFTQADQ